MGKDYSAEQLNREFHAIVLAMGSTVPRNLPIPNRDAKGVYFAMEYLRQNNKKVSNIAFTEDNICLLYTSRCV